MHQTYAAFLKRLEVGLGRSDSLSNIANWLTENTTLFDMPFSYKEHEYQIDIANDISRRLCVKKCSQVGLSELLVRKILAFLNIERNIHAIYTLPSSKFAQKFVKSRFDPVIASSPLISENLNPNVDSTEMKQFGSNFLYISGTFGQASAISIPATMVVRDEVNFCDQTVLTTYASRLRHAEGGGYLWDFSTPTVEDFAISESYNRSDRHHYLCKCKCGNEGVPEFEDMVVPGFNKSMKDFSKLDLLDPDASFDKAVMLCPVCREPWPLGDPSRRRWVAENPSIMDMRGYWVRPWDVPHFNSAPIILAQAANYETHQDYNNFVLGADYSDAQNSFIKDCILNNQTAQWTEPSAGVSGEGFVAGLDVGKTSWLTIAKRVGPNLEVLYLERIVLEGDGKNIGRRAVEVAKAFNVQRMIIDAAPDFTTALYIVGQLPVGVAYACYYTKTDQKKLSNISEKDPRVIHVNRTKAFNELAKASNGGFIKYPRHSEMKLMVDHMMAMKRVDQQHGMEGEVKSYWVNTAPDHYCHSLNYCNVASQSITEAVGLVCAFPLPEFSGVNIGGEDSVIPIGDKNLLSSERIRRKLFNGRA